jgi:hypothetical protein
MKKFSYIWAKLALLSVFLAPQSANAATIAGANLTVDGVLKAIGLAADLVSLYGLTDNNAGSDSIITEFSGNEYDFGLRIRGTEVDDTVNTRVTGEAFGIRQLDGGGTAQVKLWSFDITLQFFAQDDLGGTNDSLIINGSVTHEIGPDPGDNVQGLPLGFLLKIDSDNEVNDLVKATLNPLPQKQHPGIPKHIDKLTQVQLEGITSTSFGFIDDIDSWTFELTANHSLVPEPSSTLGLLALGTLATVSIVKRKQKSAKN